MRAALRIGGWTLAALGGLALFAGVWRAQRVEVFHAAISGIANDVIDASLRILLNPQAADAEMLALTTAELEAAREQLEALGAPPRELVAAHADLNSAIEQYLLAFDHLTGHLLLGEPPVDTDFIARAEHAGDAMHRVVAALDEAAHTNMCGGLRRLTPDCWLWP